MPFAVVLMVFVSTFSMGFVITSPATYPTAHFPWVDGECYWVGGTVQDKRIYIEGDDFYYLFLINGTVDNETPYLAEIAGSRLMYLTIPNGTYYESEVCDSITLRDALANGTVKLLNYGGLEP